MRHSPCALTRRLTSTHCITTQNTDFFQVGDYSDGKKAAATQQTKTVGTDEVRQRRQRSARLGAEGCSERARLLATSLNRRTERSNGSYKIHRKRRQTHVSGPSPSECRPSVPTIHNPTGHNCHGTGGYDPYLHPQICRSTGTWSA